MLFQEIKIIDKMNMIYIFQNKFIQNLKIAERESS